MVLRVSSEGFADEVVSRLKSRRAYVSPRGRRTVATAADSDTGLMVLAEFPFGIEQTKAALREADLEVAEGTWSDTLLEPDEDDLAPFVIAIAYRSEENKPGLWVDADFREVSVSDALRRMFDEFRANGEIKETRFDEFVRVISPNVLVLAPHQLQAWADERRENG